MNEVDEYDCVYSCLQLFKMYSEPDPPPVDLIRVPVFLGEQCQLFVSEWGCRNIYLTWFCQICLTPSTLTNSYHQSVSSFCLCCPPVCAIHQTREIRQALFLLIRPCCLEFSSPFSLNYLASKPISLTKYLAQSSVLFHFLHFFFPYASYSSVCGTLSLYPCWEMGFTNCHYYHDQHILPTAIDTLLPTATNTVLLTVIPCCW